MASFTASCSRFCIINANTLYLYDLSRDEGRPCQTFVCEKPKPKEEKEANQQKGEEGGDDGESGGRVLACGLSPRSDWLVACDDYKQVWLWSCCEDGTWSLKKRRELARRATSLAFPSCGRSVLIADKSGDVVRYCLEGDNDGQVLLGHVSMLLDVILCGPGDKYVATCDRDEKIRISHYPNAYNIQAFCLGHTDFVSRLACFAEEQVMVSGSGDGSVKLWNFETGQQLYSLDLTSEFQSETHNESECEKLGQGPATGLEGEAEGDGIMSRTKGIADVKCLACCQKNKYLAVGFEKKNKVVLLKLTKDQNGGPEVRKSQTIRLHSGDIWALHFDDTGALWVVEPSKQEPVRVYVYNQEKHEYEGMTSETDVRGVLTMIQSISTEHAGLFQEKGPPSGFETLHKVRIDNMKEYRDRKQARIDQSKQKRHQAEKNGQNECEEPNSKQAKCS